MSIRSELLSIQHSDPHNMLHVADVKNWARENTTSKLHSSIEWDNDVAAERHRDWQIRQLIQLHIVSETGEPEMVSLTVDRVAGGGYRSVSEVVAVADLRAIMLQDALNELDRVRRKYERVTELVEVWEAAERAKNLPRSRQRRSARQTISA